MSCCPASSAAKSNADKSGSAGLDQWANHLDDEHQSLDLILPTIHCGGCINTIEQAYVGIEGVTKARVNLSTKRLSLEWETDKASPEIVAGIVEGLGYEARPFDASLSGELEDDKTGKALLRALAVAGFAAANVMLLSVSVWAGAEGTTRQLFQWLSALVALPAIVYAGRPFYRSAINALRHKHLNMDVPISLAVVLAAGMSLYETINQGPETYFDAAVMLLFFLLAGRYLDHMMRERARSAVSQLLSLSTTGATVIDDHGERQFLPVAELKTGMTVAVVAGERFPVDGIIARGISDVDRSIVTGESLPEPLAPGMKIEAGVMNLTGPLEVTVTAVGQDTFLGEVIRLMEVAEEGKARYMQIADRAAQIYAPAVHALALITFLGWLWWSGGDWHTSLFTAIAVLIITCPCALGLAVPAVQIVASGMLFKRGILVKDGGAIERMATIDMVVFDKTGTLTTGEPQMLDDHDADKQHLALARALAQISSHPLSMALDKKVSASRVRPVRIDDAREVPGKGVEAVWDGHKVKLGSIEWCLGANHSGDYDASSKVALSVDGKRAAIFSFADKLRADTSSVISTLKARGLQLALLSGDHETSVRNVAKQVAIDNFHFAQTPADKVKFIEQQIAQGKKVLMVGDGINDAPSLAAASASMAPSSASDIGRTAADMVFTTQTLEAVPDALDIAKRATSHIRQNFGLAIAYNLVAVPLAVFGLATPLIAAVAMSSSSILVTTNALRLRITSSAKVKTNRAGVQTAAFLNPEADT